MKAKKSEEGHVLLDLGEAGVKRLAKSNPQPAQSAEVHSQFVAFIHERATKPLEVQQSIGYWHFGINE